MTRDFSFVHSVSFVVCTLAAGSASGAVGLCRLNQVDP
jgi:hypothetical protein